MATRRNGNFDMPHCSFCGRTPDEVGEQLIASPSGDAYICPDCVVTCADIYEMNFVPQTSTQKKKRKAVRDLGIKLHKPKEI